MDKAVALTCVPVAAPPIPDSAVADGPLLLCAGRGSLFATVSADRVAIINRALEAVFSWTPHHSHVAHILCLRSENRILTVGDDSNGIPQLRIWNLDKIDKSTNAPLLIRTITVQVNNRVFPVTAVAALESLTQIAVGLENGVVLLVRGDVGNPSRQQLKMKAVCEAGQVITGLGFKEQQSPKTEGPMQTLLYITTPSSVLMCDSTSSKEILTTIDERYGAELSCGIPTPFRDPCAAMVTARNDGIYFYDANGRGSCFMIESEKTMISWFRNYLVVVSRPSMQTSVSTLGRKSVTSPKTSSFSIKKTEVDEADEPGLGTVLTVYDLRCKFIAFHGVFDTGVAKGKRSSGIVSVASEWDELFVTTADRKMYRLEEIDMTLRLEYLFSKNMYTLALAVVNAPEGSVLPLPVSSSISGAANIDRLPNSAESDTLPLQIEIHRRHGDYLYSTGEFAPAMTQYLHTLSHLEPSYVIRKYLSANLTPLLATFLETLHTHTYMHLATHDHTTLLINCYTKMPNAHALLDAFLARTDVAFDVETVVAVCRGAGFASHAANLARRFGMHEAYLDVVIEDLKDYSHAVGYMVDGLSPATMEACLRRYGGVLVREMASEMSDLLVVVCTTTREDTEEDEIGDALTSGDDMTASMAATVENGGMILMGQRRKTNPKIISGPQTIPFPEDFVHLFVDMDECCVTFLERVLEIRWGIVFSGPADSYVERDDGTHAGRRTFSEREEASLLAVCNTLIELNLSLGTAAVSSDHMSATAGEHRSKALRVLRHPESRYDADHALILCQIHQYQAGALYLYEKMRIYADILDYYMKNDQYKFVLDTCVKFGENDPSLWTKSLLYFAERNNSSFASSESELVQILDEIDKRNLMSPLQVVQVLSQNQSVTIGAVRKYLTRKFDAEKKSASESARVVKSLQQETAAMKQRLQELQTGPIVFQSSKCAACSQSLDLPSIHFMCKHSYHLRCLDDGDGSGAEIIEADARNRECLVCSPEHRMVENIARAQIDSRANATQHDVFLKKLDSRKGDRFSVVADYFGKNLFGV